MQPSSTSFRELLSVSWKIGCRSLGGPAAQIQLLHEEFVQKRRWISEPSFQSALGWCTLIPGPEAQQLATFLGYSLHGPAGALCCGLFFLLPGSLCIGFWSASYVLFPGHPVCEWILEALRSAGLGLLLAAVLLMARRCLNSIPAVCCALASFLLFHWRLFPFALLVVLAGLLGAFLSILSSGSSRSPQNTGVTLGTTPPPNKRRFTFHPKKLRASRLATLLSFFIGLTPLLAILALLGPDHRLFQIGSLLSKAGLTTFGGAYSILPYVASEAVENLHWFAPAQMLDGLALGESTPGPLLLVLQFYGFLAAWNAPDPFSPAVAGLLGSLVALWSTFAPAYLWVLLIAPSASQTTQPPPLQNALRWVGFSLVGSLGQLGFHITQLECDRHAHNLLPFLAMVFGVLIWRLLSSKKSASRATPQSSGTLNRTETGR